MQQTKEQNKFDIIVKLVLHETEPRLNGDATLVPHTPHDPESCLYLTHTHNTQRTAHPTNGHASLGNGGGNTKHNKQHTNNKDPKPVNPT